MKRIKRKQENRWKIKIQGYKTTIKWGFTYFHAFDEMLSRLKSLGYTEHTTFALQKGRHLIKMQRIHKYGTKTIIAYVIKLPIYRLTATTLQKTI